MHENVPNLDTILVQCIASMIVNNQLLPSLTQEECALAGQVTANSFSNIK